MTRGSLNNDFMETRRTYQEGFTLIELLVVIAIIGILSSIVLASLNNARARAKDAAILRSLREFEKLLFLEHSNTKSYANLQQGWDVCTFSGNYAIPASAICNDIKSKAGSWYGTKFYSGIGSGSYATSYSVMAALNARNDFVCVGPKGTSSNTYTVLTPSSTYPWNGVGCYNNP